MLPPALLQFLTLIFGYLYPAYLCFKAIRKRRPDVKELLWFCQFWKLRLDVKELLWFCQFWVLIALVTVTERLADPILERLPMYPEAKLLLVIYLWYPDNKGTDHVYNNLLQPVLLQNEEDIDKQVDEIKGRVSDVVSQLQTVVSAYMQGFVDETIAYLTAVSAQAAAVATAQQQRQQARQQQQWQQMMTGAPDSTLVGTHVMHTSRHLDAPQEVADVDQGQSGTESYVEEEQSMEYATEGGEETVLLPDRDSAQQRGFLGFSFLRRGRTAASQT